MKQRYRKKIVTTVRRIDLQIKRIRARLKKRRLVDIDYLAVLGGVGGPTQQVINEWSNLWQVPAASLYEPLAPSVASALNDPELNGALKLRIMPEYQLEQIVEQTIDGVVYQMRHMTQSDLSVIHSDDPSAANNDGWRRSKVPGTMIRVKPTDQEEMVRTGIVPTHDDSKE